jgi:hypothetical protein
MGRLPEAEARLRSALETTVALNARPWQARTQLELATVLELAHGRAAARAAADLREDSLAIARALGASGIVALHAAADGTVVRTL